MRILLLIGLAACHGVTKDSSDDRVGVDLGLPVVLQDPVGGLCLSVQLNRGDADNRAVQLAALQGLGVREIRQDLRWDYVQPSRDAWDWSAEDLRIEAALDAGIDVIPMLAYGNPWATSQPGADAFYPPDDPADFATFAAAAAQRYGTRIGRWEIWNEPNAGYRFWKVGDPPAIDGDPVGYAALFVAAAQAIHATDPQAQAWIGGTFYHPQLIPGSIEFLEAGAATNPDFLGSADAVAFHPYTNYPPRVGPEEGADPEVALWDMISSLRNVVGALDLPITEAGWPSWGTVSEEIQADFMGREYALAHAGGIRDVCWYTLADGPDSVGNPEDAFGLLHEDLITPKPSGEAYKAMSDGLAGVSACHGRAEQALDLPEGVLAVRYSGQDPTTGADLAVTAVWTLEAEIPLGLPALDVPGCEMLPVEITAMPRIAFVRQVGVCH